MVEWEITDWLYSYVGVVTFQKTVNLIHYNENSVIYPNAKVQCYTLNRTVMLIWINLAQDRNHFRFS